MYTIHAFKLGVNCFYSFLLYAKKKHRCKNAIYIKIEGSSDACRFKYNFFIAIQGSNPPSTSMRAYGLFNHHSNAVLRVWGNRGGRRLPTYLSGGTPSYHLLGDGWGTVGGRSGDAVRPLVFLCCFERRENFSFALPLPPVTSCATTVPTRLF